MFFKTGLKGYSVGTEELIISVVDSDILFLQQLADPGYLWQKFTRVTEKKNFIAKTKFPYFSETSKMHDQDSG